MREGKCRVEHEADRRNQVEDLHVHLAHALRRGRMNQDRQREPVDLLPNRRKLRIDQILAVD